MLRRICLFAALAALTACNSKPLTVEPAPRGEVVEATASERPVDPAPTASTDTPAFVVEAEGLRLFNKQSGAARPIAFGTPRDDVLRMMAFLGKPETGQNGECGAGPLDFANWANGLGLFFQQDKFVGWNLNPRGDVTTASGVGSGSSRADLEGAYAAKISQTSLGTEFAAGALFGLLDGKGSTAKITYMWGGVSCNFR